MTWNPRGPQKWGDGPLWYPLCSRRIGLWFSGDAAHWYHAGPWVAEGTEKTSWVLPDGSAPQGTVDTGLISTGLTRPWEQILTHSDLKPRDSSHLVKWYNGVSELNIIHVEYIPVYQNSNCQGDQCIIEIRQLLYYMYQAVQYRHKGVK